MLSRAFLIVAVIPLLLFMSWVDLTEDSPFWGFSIAALLGIALGFLLAVFTNLHC